MSLGARRFKEHQEMVSKVVKQQEDIKKKRRQKITSEEAFERKNIVNQTINEGIKVMYIRLIHLF